MFAWTACLEPIGAGTSLIVGTVGADGEPRATRAWGAQGRRRATADACASSCPPTTTRSPSATSPTAWSPSPGADVRTLRSVQLKGRDRRRRAGQRRRPRARAPAHSRGLLPAVVERDRRHRRYRLLRRLLPLDAGRVRGGRRRACSTRRPGPTPARPVTRRHDAMPRSERTARRSATSSGASAARSPAVLATAVGRRHAERDVHARRPTGSTTSGSPCPTSSCRRRPATWPRTRGRACC